MKVNNNYIFLECDYFKKIKCCLVLVPYFIFQSHSCKKISFSNNRTLIKNVSSYIFSRYINRTL